MLAPLYAQRNGDAQPRGRRDRPRAHRHRLAVAARGDVPQVRAHVQLADRATWTRYPEYRFACSQAQQYAWIKERNPDLYAADPGSASRAAQFVPVGGTLGRARLQHALRRVARPAVPATASASSSASSAGAAASSGTRTSSATTGSCRRSCASAGITRFLTQKLSWNAFNRPTYHTFLWQGIDGSEVLAHFPPADTYNGEASVAGAPLETARDYKDHDRSRTSLLLFGYGDGGGGPTQADARGAAPRGRPPGASAHDAAHERGVLRARSRPRTTDWPVVVGELYFEYHRGTYTSQAATKRGNRRERARCCTTPSCSPRSRHWRGAGLPARRDRRACGSCCCCNQFHDILPGLVDRARSTRTPSATTRDPASGESLRERRSPRSPAAPRVARQHGRRSRGARSSVTRRSEPSLVAAPPLGRGRVERPDEPVALTEVDGLAARERAPARTSSTRAARLRASSTRRAGREALAGAGERRRDLRGPAGRTGTPGTWIRSTWRRARTVAPATCLARRHARAAARRDRVRAHVGERSAARRRSGSTPMRDASSSTATVDWQREHKMLKVLLPGERAQPERDLRDAVRRGRAPDALHDVVRPRPLRGPGAPLGRPVRARLRSRAADRLEVRLQHASATRCASACCARRGCRTRWPTWASTRSLRDLSARGGWQDGGVVAEARRLQRAAARGRPPRSTESFASRRRPEPRARHDQARRSARMRSSCGCTRRTGRADTRALRLGLRRDQRGGRHPARGRDRRGAVRRLGDRARLPPVRDHHADAAPLGLGAGHSGERTGQQEILSSPLRKPNLR